MADLTTNLEQIETAQAQKEVTANALFDAMSPGSYGGRHAEACGGLIWGYYGGRWAGSLNPNGTLTLSASVVNYIVANRLTGEISLADGSPSEWFETGTYGRLYKVTTGASTVTDFEDHRAGDGGLFQFGGSMVSGASIQIVDAAGNFGSPSPTLEIALAELADRIAGVPVTIQFACSDLAAAITAGTSKAVFRMPHALTVTAVRASLATAQASGSIFTVDINAAGSTILGTKLTVDNTEKTSTTAATPAVVSDTSLADDQEITVDVDQIGDGTAKGLVLTLIGTRA